MQKLLDEHVARGREQFKQQAELVQRIGELNGRLIFLGAAGRIPPEIREAVMDTLTTHTEPSA